MEPRAARSERTYALYEEFASGGMATIHFGRVVSDAGFARTVAIKRLHAQFAREPQFLAMFLDEANLAARVQHPNVVATYDVAAIGDEVFLVMEYVRGESLARLIEAAKDNHASIAPSIAASIASGMLHGLHAAHEATNAAGEPLAIVHRDVSPQNVLVGADGVARVLDFGIAKASGQIHATREGEIKGKLRYMAPEQIAREKVDRRADVYAAGIVLWELLTGRSPFDADNDGALIAQILGNEISRPSTIDPAIPPALDEVVSVALARDPARRFGTARRMALALEAAIPAAGPVRVGEWVEELAGDTLAKRAAIVARIESGRASVDGASAKSSVLRIEGKTGTITTTRRSLRSRRFAYAAVLTGLAAAFAGGVVLARTRPIVAPALPTAIASVAPEPPAESAAPIAPSAETTASAPTPSARPAKPRGRPTPPIAAPAKTARADCSPPYRWESGVKVPKPGCPLD